MENVHMRNMLVENLMLQQKLEKPCFIVMHPTNLERMAITIKLMETKGHIFSGADWCELDAVYMIRLEDETE